MTNYDSVVQQLEGFGLDLRRTQPPSNGLLVGYHKPVRCKTVDGDRELRGWYSLHEVVNNAGEAIIVGSYGIWHGNDNNVQKVRVDRGALSSEQADALKKRLAADRKQAEAARKAEAERAASEAGRVWRGYLPAGGVSDYLTRKGVAAHGLRWAPSGDGTCAVPMCDADGKVWGLQILRGKGRAAGKLEKEYFPRGLAKKGKFHTIGVIRDLVLIAEGYATAATLHESTGLPVAVAFDAGNLAPVAEAIRKKHRRARILVCADDDYLTEGNPGCKAAETAALAVGGAWVKPEFISNRDGKKLTDFNDLAALDGSQAVRSQIEAAVAKMGGTAAATIPARGSLPEGGGESMPSRISIDEAASRYWGTYGLGGDVLFDEAERRLVHKKDVVNLLPRHGWDTLKEHPDWRVARDNEIGFDPTEKDTSVRCNLFGGWPSVPKAGTCTFLLELLEYLCSNEQNEREVYNWILKWLAYPLQHRGAKMHSAIVVHGPQGTGKSRFFEAYGRIFGPYFRVLGQEALEDKFNADWAEKKLFILADEVLARAEMYHTKNRLKGFITGDSIRVNPKNVAAHTEKNCMNIVFLSNERQPIVLENDDRRHCVIWVPPKLDDAFFAEVNAEIDNGGVEALHHHLLELDLGDFKPWTRPPMTRAKQELVDLGTSSEERFVREWTAGEIEQESGEALPFIPCLGSHLYIAYERWCDAHGERKRGKKDLLSLVGKLPGWRAGESSPTWSTLRDHTVKNRKMVVPPDAALTGMATPQDLARERHATKAEWLTACFFAFSLALGVE
jgi:putative DNA primase/helicase